MLIWPESKVFQYHALCVSFSYSYHLKISSVIALLWHLSEGFSLSILQISLVMSCKTQWRNRIAEKNQNSAPSIRRKYKPLLLCVNIRDFSPSEIWISHPFLWPKLMSKWFLKCIVNIFKYWKEEKMACGDISEVILFSLQLTSKPALLSSPADLRINKRIWQNTTNWRHVSIHNWQDTKFCTKNNACQFSLHYIHSYWWCLVHRLWELSCWDGAFCLYSMSNFIGGGRHNQIIYLSKSNDTTPQKYSITIKSPAFNISLK